MPCPRRRNFRLPVTPTMTYARYCRRAAARACSNGFEPEGRGDRMKNGPSFAALPGRPVLRAGSAGTLDLFRRLLLHGFVVAGCLFGAGRLAAAGLFVDRPTLFILSDSPGGETGRNGHTTDGRSGQQADGSESNFRGNRCTKTYREEARSTAF